MSKAGNSAKFGRGSRSPSSKTYRLAQRWISNKAKRIKREARRVAKAAIRKILRKDAAVRDHARLAELRRIVSQNLTGGSSSPSA